MDVIIVNECCVDGCYKKHMKDKGMCKEHQDMYESGKKLYINYGQAVQKKIAKETKNEN